MERDTFLATLGELNDNFRRTFIAGAIIVSPRFEALDANVKSLVHQELRRVRTQRRMGPRKRARFSRPRLSGCNVIALVDYWSLDEPGAYSDDATNPAVTRRVLTVRFADERGDYSLRSE